jgi:uncharacterized protein (DUF362 family)
MKKPIDRRDFLKCSLAGTIASCTIPFLSSCFPKAGDQWLECKLGEQATNINDALTKVVEVYDSLVYSQETAKVDEVRVGEMFRRSLLELTGTATLAEAWGSVFSGYSAGQKIGIKVNTLNQKVPTRPELVKAMVESLLSDFGIAKENILVWDRRGDELEGSGFTEAYVGAQCIGTFVSTRDESGPGFQAFPCCLGDGMTYLSKIPAEDIDYMINFAVLKNHSQSGITACMKNNYGCIKNPEDFHTDFENDIPVLNKMSFIKDKTKLFMVDAILTVCAGDTSSPADCVPSRLLSSLDPVAIDYRSKLLIDEERVKKGLAANPDMAWIAKARDIGLGSMNVDLVTVNL